MSIKYLITFSLIFSGSLPFAQTYPDLLYRETGNINLFYSHQTEEDPIFLAEMTNQANDYFIGLFGDLDMQFDLLVLNPEDWEKHAISNLIYGMPHFRASVNAIVVASDDNLFWRTYMPDVDGLESPFRELFPMTYTMEDGNLSSRYFFDLLTIHELAHLWTNKGERSLQRLWLEEMFCNLALHTFIAQKRSEWLGALEVLPSFHATQGAEQMQYTSLEEFEANYMKIGMEAPHNYGWYQSRFHYAAKLIYDEGGAEVLKKLWDFLGKYQEKLSDEELEKKLAEEVHPFFKTLIDEW